MKYTIFNTIIICVRVFYIVAFFFYNFVINATYS